jgi:integral membrane protein
MVPGTGRSAPADPVEPMSGVEGALLRYRIMAFVIGTGLFILVFVGMPLQYAAGHPAVDAVVGPIHGFFYIVYLMAAVDLARRARFTLLQMAAMVGAGFLPFLAFIIEHRVNLRVREMLAEAGSARAPRS